MRYLTPFCLFLALFSSATQAGQLSPQLAEIRSGFSGQEVIPVLVQLADQLDLDYLDAQLTRQQASRALRHQTIVSAADDLAEQTQSDLTSYLDDLQAQGKVIRYVTYRIVNAIEVEIQVDQLDNLAARPEVRMIYEMPHVQTQQWLPADRPPSGEVQQRSVESNLAAIHVPQVWYELGYTGEGRLTGNIDSGVDVRHEALHASWRGNNGAPAEACWFGETSEPRDDATSHGTHVMGIQCGIKPAEGENPADTIGVAPGALWIAATNTNVMASLNWIIDPDGNPETLDDVPDVVNNSWELQQQCDPNHPILLAIETLEAAGIVSIWSAGNSGPNSGTIVFPQSYVNDRYSGFCVGNLNHNTMEIVSSSSRGPSNCPASLPDSLSIKPEVSAPGYEVYSCVSISDIFSYLPRTGTSQAAPHVSGVVTLMRQKNPDIEVNEIKQILMDTAQDLGSPGEDNDFGWGLIDAYAAVMAVPPRYGVTGIVTDERNGDPIGGARVFTGNQQTYSLADGSYFLRLEPGEYRLHAQARGFEAFEAENLITVGNENSILDISLRPEPNWGHITGTVIDTEDHPVVNLTLQATYGIYSTATTTGDEGMYDLAIPGGVDYQLTMRMPENSDLYYDLLTLTVPMAVDGHNVLDLVLNPAESFELDNGDFNISGDGSLWEWGTPSEEGGPVPVYSGEKCWGTVLEGSYPQMISFDQYLDTPAYNITSADDQLKFYQWYETAEGTDGGNVQVSTNGGTSWSIIEPVGGYPFASLPHLLGEAGFSGISGGGEEPVWVQAAFDLAAYEGQTVHFRFRFKSFQSGSRGRGWFIDHLSVGQSYVAQLNEIDPPVVVAVNVPQQVRLYANYPNPFNPQTTIRYDLPQAEHVTLTIYDVHGHLIRTLIEDKQDAGTYKQVWNGTDTKGKAVKSGVFIYRLQAGDHTQSRSMVLLR